MNDESRNRPDAAESCQEISKARLRSRKIKAYLIAIAATIMALGQFSEAVTLIEDGINSLRSRFTNTVEYNQLSNIHVSNTESYIASLMGTPQVSRAIDDKVVANYYHNEKFLLTVFIGDHRVVAYTVLPLRDDFKPVVLEQDGTEWVLGDMNYADFPANPQLYVVDHSKTISYYLESLDTGRTGLFVQTYLGNIYLGSSSQNELLVDLYDEEVNGSDEDVLEAQTRLRTRSHPNLFGRGVLALELVQKSILTGAEFKNYFGG